MTDHLKNSIDQNFPPEPPDDPRPEPVPPPDDLLPPCPNCGSSDIATPFANWRHCQACNFALFTDEWDRLARAVALLRAVERLGTIDAWFEAFPETLTWQARILEGAGGVTSKAHHNDLINVLIALGEAINAS